MDQTENLGREQPESAPVVGEKTDRIDPENIGKQPRDETGKFAAKQQQTEGEPGEEGERHGTVPHQALHAERQKLKEERERGERMERELYELRGMVQARFAQQPQQPKQPEQPPPDWFTDPDAALKARLAPIEEKLQSMGQGPRQVAESMSRMIAMDRFGPEVVNEAYRAADTAMRSNPALQASLKARLEASEHPFGELVRWHKEQTTLSQVGEEDLAAFQEWKRARESAAREPPLAEGQQQQPAHRAAPQNLPQNFANTRSAGPRSQPQWSGPKPISEMFGGR